MRSSPCWRASTSAAAAQASAPSVEAYSKGGRPELAAKEEAEIAIIAEFLPRALSEDELHDLVVAAVDEAGAASPRDLGRVMGLLAPRTRGRADGRTVSAMVAAELARRAG